jgi:hypothetical protein
MWWKEELWDNLLDLTESLAPNSCLNYFLTMQDALPRDKIWDDLSNQLIEAAKEDPGLHLLLEMKETIVKEALWDHFLDETEEYPRDDHYLQNLKNKAYESKAQAWDLLLTKAEELNKLYPY